MPRSREFAFAGQPQPHRVHSSAYSWVGQASDPTICGLSNQRFELRRVRSPEVKSWANDGMEEAMHADRVEVSWDAAKSNWLIRVEVGEETIRRHCKIPRDADEQTLRSVAKKTLQEEGYDPDVAEINIHR